MLLKQIYDAGLSQYAYLIGCQRTGESILIDPERDVDRYLDLIKANGLRLTAVTETHIHADFLSGSLEILETQPAVTAYLSDEGDQDWKYEWARGREDVRLIKEGSVIKVGNIQITVLHTPGHTPEHVSFLVEDQGGGADEPMALVTGDFLFVGDVGRPDLLESAAGEVGAREPSAQALYASLQRFKTLPEFLQVLPGHGAGSACGKALGAIPSSTVGYEVRFNGALKSALNDGEQEFVSEILEGQPEPPVYFSRMKNENKVGAKVLNGLPHPPHLEAGAFIQEGTAQKSVILDTNRARKDFMQSHLKGSLLAPLGDKFSVVTGSYVQPEEQIYLLLNNEEEVDGAVRALVRIGLDHIAGYALWEDVRTHSSYQENSLRTKMGMVAQMDHLQEEHLGYQILDVRSLGEYEAGHVEGAINVAHTRLAHRIEELQGRSYIVHCGSGLRASLSVPYLERMGIEVLYADGFYQDYACAL